MTELARYNAALSAIAEAKAVDELLSIHNQADALRAAARVANNKQAEIDMAEIRFRAERRVGEMMAAQRDAGLLSEGAKGVGKRVWVSEKPTLAEAGIDKNLADRARKLAAIPKQEFDSIVGDWRGRVEAEGERVTVNLLKAGAKSLSRDEKEAALADRIRAGVDALNQGRFGVILADPPWRFEPYSRETGMDRAADNHYPTMDAGAIAELQVPAADDCVLFLWATAPMLPVALHVMAAWGFDYKSQIVWVKDRIGTGYWARNKHELLLIGTRGSIPAPAPGTQPESAIAAPVGAHSEKPEVFHQIIERLFPSLPKIEMFSRRARNGWHGWGAESETTFDAETGEITEPAGQTVEQGGEGGAALPADESTAALMEVPVGSETPTADDPGDRGGAAGTQAPPVDTNSAAADQSGNVDGTAGRSQSARHLSTESPAIVPLDTNSQPLDITDAAETSPAGAEGDADRPPNSPGKKQWTYADHPHADCLDPGQCGGFSNLGLCVRCKEAAGRIAA